MTPQSKPLLWLHGNILLFFILLPSMYTSLNTKVDLPIIELYTKLYCLVLVILLCLDSFIQHWIGESHLILWSITIFLHFWHHVVFYYINIPSFHHLFFHFTIDGHFSCFQLWAIMNDTTVSFLVLVSWWTWDAFQLGAILGVEVLEHGVRCIFTISLYATFPNQVTNLPAVFSSSTSSKPQFWWHHRNHR